MLKHQTTPTHTGGATLEERVTFFFVAIGVVAITYGVLYLIDFLPGKPTPVPIETASTTPTTAIDTVETEVRAAHPVRIAFDALEREVVVLNPEDSTVAALDSALLQGVVRHPDSADFKNTGTIFLLGHSSHLPTVRNKNFQAFNGIEKLKWGDTVRLFSSDTEYVYSVDRVYEAKASTAEVPLQFEEETLVLATCNSFGSKDDRFIVEATLVGKYPLQAEDESVVGS